MLYLQVFKNSTVSWIKSNLDDAVKLKAKNKNCA